MRTAVWRVLEVIGATLVAAMPAYGQSSGSAPAVPAPRWEIEAYGGVSLGRLSSSGTITLPLPGAPIATSSPIYPSWRVPTWFLGDGAAFANQVAEQFGLTSRIVPLDDALGPSGLNDSGTVVFGARVRHPLRGRYSVEGGVEVLSTAVDLSDDLMDAITAARTSFETTFTELLATGPFTSPQVTSASSRADGSSREVVVTGALVADFGPWGGFVPYAIAGGGVVTQVGDPPSVGIEGRYRAFIDGAAPIDETDRLTLRYGQKTAAVIVLGGGLRRDFSPRWGLRFDARVLVGPSTTRVAIDADPLVATGAPARYIESFTYPNLQFSNNRSTGRDSTLSGALDGFDAFDGGWQTRFRVTAGVFWRF
jgi:hypothetical protein